MSPSPASLVTLSVTMIPVQPNPTLRPLTSDPSPLCYPSCPAEAPLFTRKKLREHVRGHMQNSWCISNISAPVRSSMQHFSMRFGYICCFDCSALRMPGRHMQDRCSLCAPGGAGGSGPLPSAAPFAPEGRISYATAASRACLPPPAPPSSPAPSAVPLGNVRMDVYENVPEFRPVPRLS